MTDDLKDQLDGLAVTLLRVCAENATNEDGMPIEHHISLKIDVFKAVAAYYLGCRRVAPKDKKSSESSDGAPSFDTLLRDLKGGSYERQ